MTFCSIAIARNSSYFKHWGGGRGQETSRSERVEVCSFQTQHLLLQKSSTAFFIFAFFIFKTTFSASTLNKTALRKKGQKLDYQNTTIYCLHINVNDNWYSRKGRRMEAFFYLQVVGRYNYSMSLFENTVPSLSWGGGGGRKRRRIKEMIWARSDSHHSAERTKKSNLISLRPPATLKYISEMVGEGGGGLKRKGKLSSSYSECSRLCTAGYTLLLPPK